MREFARFPRIKICGLADPKAAASIAHAGADAIGLVEFAGSPRAVTVARAAEVVACLPRTCIAVAVMVDAEPLRAARWLEATRAHAVQLCGSEVAREWSDFPAPIMRRIGVHERAEAELDAWRGLACGFVLDHPDAPGGTGRTVDAALAARVASAARPCLLAGGLDERNVAERIRATGPDGVDASSRLESSPGTKDLPRVLRFVEAARRALEELGR
jgi:phosphoribosylanthranilate isomerase